MLELVNYTTHSLDVVYLNTTETNRLELKVYMQMYQNVLGGKFIFNPWNSRSRSCMFLYEDI
jgi:hypothetical protein